MSKIPAIILICLCAIGLICSAYCHGKPKVGKNNFWIILIAYSLQLFILWWGGFFNCLIH